MYKVYDTDSLIELKYLEYMETLRIIGTIILKFSGFIIPNNAGRLHETLKKLKIAFIKNKSRPC